MSTLTNEITKTIIYGPHLHTLATPSKVQSNPNLQQNKDYNNSWTFINRHHSVTFNRTSIYYGAFTIILLMIGTLIFLFLLRGDEKIP